MPLIPLRWTAAPLTQNKVRNLHYQTEARIKRTLIAEASACIKAARTKPLDRAEVTLHYRLGTRRIIDADGLAPTLKCCLDALVKCRILPGDSWAYVPIVSIRLHPPEPGIEAALWLELAPVEAGR